MPEQYEQPGSSEFGEPLGRLADYAQRSSALRDAGSLRARGTRRARRRRIEAVVGSGALAVAALGLVVSFTAKGPAPLRVGAAAAVTTSSPAPAGGAPSSGAPSASTAASAGAPSAGTAASAGAPCAEGGPRASSDPHPATTYTLTEDATNFNATTESTSGYPDITALGITANDVTQGLAQLGFTHVTLTDRPDNAVPAGRVIDIEDQQGHSILGTKVEISRLLVVVVSTGR
jgi:hypothetical protein